jgi:hypothetical protein
MVGFCALLEKLSGPIHDHEVPSPPFSVKLISPPSHTGELLVALAVGFG